VRSRLSNEEVAYLWGEQSGGSDFDEVVSPMTHTSGSHSNGRHIQKAGSQRSIGSKSNRRSNMRRGYSSTSLYSVGETEVVAPSDVSSDLQSCLSDVMANMSNEEWVQFSKAAELADVQQSQPGQPLVVEAESPRESLKPFDLNNLSPVTENTERTDDSDPKRKRGSKRQSSRSSQRSVSMTSQRSTKVSKSPKKSAMKPRPSPGKSPRKETSATREGRSKNPRNEIETTGKSSMSSPNPAKPPGREKSSRREGRSIDRRIQSDTTEKLKGDGGTPVPKVMNSPRKDTPVTRENRSKDRRIESDATVRLKGDGLVSPTKSTKSPRKDTPTNREGRSKARRNESDVSVSSSKSTKTRKKRNAKESSKRPGLGPKQISLSGIPSDAAPTSRPTTFSPPTRKREKFSSKSKSLSPSRALGRQPSLHTVFEWNKETDESNPSDPPAGAKNVVMSTETPRKGGPQQMDRRKMLRKSLSTTDVNQYSLTPKWPPKRLGNRSLHAQFYRRQTNIAEMVPPPEKKDAGSVSPEMLLEIIEPMSMRELLGLNGFTGGPLTDDSCVNYGDILDNQSATSSSSNGCVKR